MECIICAYPIDNKERLLALTPCNHQEHVCSICFLRMRSLQRNLTCPSCKRHLDHVICSFTEDTVVQIDNTLNQSKAKKHPKGKSTGKEPDNKTSDISSTVDVLFPKRSFDDFEIWGENINAPNYTFDARSQMYVPKFYFDGVISKLWEIKCKICDARRKDIKDLRGHYYGEHKLHMCLLCIESKHVFPSEQTVYTPQEYERHLRFGDQDGCKGHPNCEFCKKRFYDSVPLFQHLTRDHFSCHLCSKDGIRFRYYNKYSDLEAHFKNNHFFCEEPECIERRFLAFSNEIDLIRHRQQFHPHLVSGRVPIPIQFKYRNNSNNNSSSSLSGGNAHGTNDGSAPGDGVATQRTAQFEGGLGGRSNNGEWQVEFESLATDERDPNRNILRDDAVVTSAVSMDSTPVGPVEDFPELPSASGSSVASHMQQRWGVKANNNLHKKREEAFPALPSAPKKNPMSVAVKKGPAFSPTIVVPPRAPASTSSTVSDVMGDFEAISASGSRPTTSMADSLSLWGNVKTKAGTSNNKTAATKKPESTAAKVATSTRQNELNEDDFSADLQQAMALSLADQYPSTSALVATNTSTNAPSKKKPTTSQKKSTSSDWDEALKSVGMTTNTKKKQPSSTSGVRAVQANATAAQRLQAARDSLLSKDNNRGLPAHGGWVTLGGAGDRNKSTSSVYESKNVPGYPSLSSANS